MYTAFDVYKMVMACDDDRSNPVYAGNCLYTGEDGEHCIAGQILSDLGFDLPDFGDDDNWTTVSDLVIELGYNDQFDTDAMEILAHAQVLADRFTHHGHADAWGMTKVEIAKDYANDFERELRKDANQ